MTTPKPTPAIASLRTCSCVSSAIGSESSPLSPRWPARRSFGRARATSACCVSLLAPPRSPPRLFLRIQTPYIHHLDLIAPAIVVPIAASLMLLFARAPRVALLGLGRAWRDHALAVGGGAQSAGPRADRRTAARAARRPRRTRAPEGLGRSARAARRQGLRPRLELYVQRPAHRRIVAAPSGARPERAQARRRDARRRYGRRAAGSGPEGLRHHHRRRSGSDPPRSQLSADGHRAVARNADGAGDRRKVPPHRRSLPSGEGRQRGRVRAPGAAGRRGHRRAAGALASGARRAGVRGGGGKAAPRS